MLTTMDYQKTMQALKRLRVETGSLACLGCGYEHSCATHGCAILRNAVGHMEAALANYDYLSALTKQQSEDIQALERACALTPPNEWVSVEDALPPNMDDVLVVVQNNGECWTVTGYYSKTSKVWYAVLNGYDTQMDVLWWMPLPAPPDRRPP